MAIRDVFLRLSKVQSFDKKFATRVKAFYNGFINKNPEHSGFFGSGLLAVHRLRWTDQETGNWFDDIVEGDRDEIQEALWELDTVDRNHIVASDALNLSVIYLVHRVMTSKALNAKEQHECAVHLISILHFKYISSILTNYFQYGSDPQIALRTYEAMNFKFDLKVLKTWGNLINARAESIIAKTGIHYKTFLTFSDDEDIQYAVTDPQTRIRVVIKKLTALYYEVRADDGRVVSMSSMVEVDGELEVRDLTRTLSTYSRYLKEIIVDGPSFIRLELVNTVAGMNPSMTTSAFVQTLNWVSANYQSNPKAKLGDYVDKVLEFSFDLIKEKGIDQRNLVAVSEALKGIINASRNKERDVLYLRNEGDKIVRAATGRKSPTPVSGERTGLILYLVLRAMTVNYFKKR